MVRSDLLVVLARARSVGVKRGRGAAEVIIGKVPQIEHAILRYHWDCESVPEPSATSQA